jgi:hypothetical protein
MFKKASALWECTGGVQLSTLLLTRLIAFGHSDLVLPVIAYFPQGRPDVFHDRSHGIPSP